VQVRKVTNLLSTVLLSTVRDLLLTNSTALLLLPLTHPEYNGPTVAYSALGITQLHLPTVDHFEPSVESMGKAVKFIKEHQTRGEKVYVHCKAGHGRAAAITLCWMLNESPEVTAEEANALLHSKRKVRQTLWKQQNVQAFKAQLDVR